MGSSLGLCGSLLALSACGDGTSEQTSVLAPTSMAGATGAMPPASTGATPPGQTPPNPPPAGGAEPPSSGGASPSAGGSPTMGQGGAQGGSDVGGAPGGTGSTGAQGGTPPASSGGADGGTGATNAGGGAGATGGVSTGSEGTTDESSTQTGSETSTGDTTSGDPAGPQEPEPSSGCGNSPGPTGSANQPLTINHSNGTNQYYVKLPGGYDQSHPYPVVMMFNPTNNPISWAEQNAGFEQTGAAQEAIRVYPNMMTPTSGWVAADVPFFEPFYNALLENFCIDKTRVFAAGESSGGDFVSILGCEHADKLRAVAPCATKNVPQYPLNVDQRNCTGQVASVVIHSPDDMVVWADNGEPTRDFYRSLNHCGMMSTPVEGYTDPESNCFKYEGCDEGYPVFWCPHGDSEYDGTFHGWPAFAPKMLWELFTTL